MLVFEDHSYAIPVNQNRREIVGLHPHVQIPVVRVWCQMSNFANFGYVDKISWQSCTATKRFNTVASIYSKESTALEVL